MTTKALDVEAEKSEEEGKEPEHQVEEHETEESEYDEDEAADSDEDDKPGCSKLGRKDYWEATYRQERANLRDVGDVGEIW